jgi:hypothetical protein
MAKEVQLFSVSQTRLGSICQRKIHHDQINLRFRTSFAGLVVVGMPHTNGGSTTTTPVGERQCHHRTSRRGCTQASSSLTLVPWHFPKLR